jgi:hypothetical protein
MAVFFPDDSDRESWMRHQRIIETLRIRVPEQLYVASSGAPAAPEKKLFVRRQPPLQLPQTPSAADSPNRAGRYEARKRPPRRRHLELPEMPRRLNTTQTILQPQFAPEMRPPASTRLPEVFFWAPRTGMPPVVTPFVEPGRETQPVKPRLLDAPPKLEVPAAEPAAPGAPQVPDSYETLRLVVPPRLPVRTSQPQNGVPQTGVSADPTSGDPTNLLSLALDPQRMRELLSVPPGNQLGQLPEGGAFGPSALTAASGSGGAGTASGSGTGSGPGAGSGAPRLAGPAESAPAQPAEGSSASVAALRAMALAAAAPTRVVHPAGGVFDVVVQSGDTEGFPESSGILSGKPVYSAYVRAGGSQDWLLQYCIPAGEDTVAQVSGYVVRLTTGAPLVAPYPRVTMRPPVKPRPGRHVMVHGYITTEGRFRDLKVLAASAPSEAEMAQAVLDQWEFRPASRDGKPVEVEILLAIPAE